MKNPETARMRFDLISSSIRNTEYRFLTDIEIDFKDGKWVASIDDGDRKYEGTGLYRIEAVLNLLGDRVGLDSQVESAQARIAF